MTQEEKELLLIDLCARLPYMPKIKIIYQQQGIKGTDEGNVSCDAIEHIVNDLRNGVITHMQIYLRPMSSMTDDEKREFESFGWRVDELDNNYPWAHTGEIENILLGLNWLNTHHFDYRGLIPMGLAIEAPEGMYNLNKK